MLSRNEAQITHPEVGEYLNTCDDDDGAGVVAFRWNLHRQQRKVRVVKYGAADLLLSKCDDRA